jgi:hypothetical protein
MKRKRQFPCKRGRDGRCSSMCARHRSFAGWGCSPVSPHNACRPPAMALATRLPRLLAKRCRARGALGGRARIYSAHERLRAFHCALAGCLGCSPASPRSRALGWHVAVLDRLHSPCLCRVTARALDCSPVSPRWPVGSCAPLPADHRASVPSPARTTSHRARMRYPAPPAVVLMCARLSF